MSKAIGLLVLSLGGLAWGAGKFTDKQLAARFYNDLGPDEVDVSAYPPQQRENYKLFAKTCSQCHTLARPLNSPFVGAKTWKRYVERMHLKTKNVAGAVIREEDEKAIVDFLAFDARLRKVTHKAAFDGSTRRLRAMYEDVLKERARLADEADQKKIKQLPPDSGSDVKPSALQP